MSRYRLRAYFYLILVAVIWGTAGPVIKFTLDGLDPLPFITYRLTISAVISLVFFLNKLRKGRKFRQLRANLPLSLLYGFLAVPVALGILFIGLDKSTVLDLTLIGVIGPLMVTAGAAIFFRDHITRREKIGIAIVLLGVIFNSLFPIFKSGEGLKLTGNILLILFLFADSSAVLI